LAPPPALSHIQLLEQVTEKFPSGHKYASRLNLIEPWWKQLRSLALKGKRFENTQELVEAFIRAIEFWNAHKHPDVLKKKIPELSKSILGGFGSALHS
jgi:hypothetical protein